MQPAEKMGIVKASVAPVVIILMMLLPATASRKSNPGNGSCEGGGADCLVGDIINWEEEFMMESETSRRLLLDYGDAVTTRSSDPKSPAVACGQGQSYRDCLPKKNEDDGDGNVPPPDVPSPDVPSPDVPSPDVPSPDVPSPDVPPPDAPPPADEPCDRYKRTCG